MERVTAGSDWAEPLYREPGSRRVATGRVLERLSPPPGEMFSPLYGNGRTTLCAMSAPVQEKQAALSQLPARLLPPAVRASPRAVRAEIVGLAQTPIWCLWLTQLYRRGKSTG